MPDLRSIAPDGNLDKAIAWWPVDTAIMVLRELMQQREQTKQAIYEITGISDIVRGASNSKETATAQQIKTQWGSLRIKRMQNMLARHVRDIFILTAEIMSKQFAPESILRASGVSLELPPPQMPQDPMQAQQMQMEHQRKQAEYQQQVMGLLKNIDHYRIDVESDSTVRADLTQKRGEMAEFLNGTAQFFNTMAPLIQQAPGVAGPVVDLYAAFARQFSLGKQAEDALDQLTELAKQAQTQQQGQPGPDPVEMEKVKIQKQKVDQDGQKAVADFQLRARQQQHQEKKDVAELQLEAQQQRAVAIGPT